MPSPTARTQMRRPSLGIDAVLADPGPLAQVASSADDPGGFTEDFCRWREVPRSSNWRGIPGSRGSPPP